MSKAAHVAIIDTPFSITETELTVTPEQDPFQIKVSVGGMDILLDAEACAWLVKKLA